jgi:ADP-dependent NAD(P)H-hydrate dehydratase / NAD(P)H-hydrate epimerase
LEETMMASEETALLDQSALLTVAEMYRADHAAAAAGIPSLELMEAAGGAIAREIRARWSPRPTVVLCGPGNNGGDGFVVARVLAARGWPVRLGLLGPADSLQGDAAVNAERWTGEIRPIEPALLDRDPLVVDALFGAGLTRAPEGAAAEAIAIVNARRLDCVAVDVPSGVAGDSGAVLGVAPRCRLTVTFFRAKPGHWLLPGRELCGQLAVADIGIPAFVLADIGPRTFVNAPPLWLDRIPWPRPGGNKYSRGHAVILGGMMSGAARLAADGARRMAAGLVTIAAPAEALGIFAAGAPGTIVVAAAERESFDAYIADERRNAVLIGPGAGVTAETRERVLAALKRQKACVLDADALTVFAGDHDAFYRALNPRCVLTPHEGEFGRVFAVEGDKLTRTRAAAARAGAIVLLKGADTVIAAPDGRAAINTNAPPNLATAGSGDVLAGMILGLVAARMEPFEAACAASWIHGQIAAGHGPGLIAEDLASGIPGVLGALKARSAEGLSAPVRCDN